MERRVLGDAAIKYRLLQSRGYVVLPIDCREWDGRNGDTKALYIQQMIDRLAAAVEARGVATTTTGSAAAPRVSVAAGSGPGGWASPAAGQRPPAAAAVNGQADTMEGRRDNESSSLRDEVRSPQMKRPMPRSPQTKPKESS